MLSLYCCFCVEQNCKSQVPVLYIHRTMVSKLCKYHWKFLRSSYCVTPVLGLSNSGRLLTSSVPDFVVGNKKTMHMHEEFCDSDKFNVCAESRVNVCSRLHAHARICVCSCI